MPQKIVSGWQDWNAAEADLRRIGVFKIRPVSLSRILGNPKRFGRFHFQCKPTLGTNRVRVLFKPSDKLLKFASALRALDGKPLSVRKLAHYVKFKRSSSVMQNADHAARPPSTPKSGA
jgi:hypothetical protein